MGRSKAPQSWQTRDLRMMKMSREKHCVVAAVAITVLMNFGSAVISARGGSMESA